MHTVIGVDIGTTNTKAVAFTDHGEVLCSASASYPVYTDADGRHELEPDVLMEAVVSALRGVLGKVGGRIDGIGFSCAMHSHIAVDGDGRPLTRAMTWADTRSEAYAAALKGTVQGQRIYAVTGTPVHAMSPLCKLLWMKEEQAEVYQRAVRFIGIKEYIWWRFFGEYKIDHSIASATGLFDIRRRDWNPESLGLAGIDAGRLSEPMATTYWTTGLRPEWVSLGLAGDLPFVIGASDGCLANLGTGAVGKGDTAVTIGTSGAIRMTTALPESDQKERIFSYILNNEHYVCGGATNNGGNVLQWYAEKVLGRRPGDAAELAGLVEEAAAIAPGAEGLVFLPYLLGERAPVWDASAKGVFFGIRSIHDQRHFLRAVLEGVSLSLRQIGDSLEETIGPIGRIYASGGFTHSKVWLQLMADIFQKKVVVTGTADASAVGAAQIGLVAIGVLSSMGDAAALVKVEAEYEPNEANGAKYEWNYTVFKELYTRLKDLM